MISLIFIRITWWSVNISIVHFLILNSVLRIHFCIGLAYKSIVALYSISFMFLVLFIFDSINFDSSCMVIDKDLRRLSIISKFRFLDITWFASTCMAIDQYLHVPTICIYLVSSISISPMLIRIAWWSINTFIVYFSIIILNYSVTRMLDQNAWGSINTLTLHLSPLTFDDSILQIWIRLAPYVAMSCFTFLTRLAAGSTNWSSTMCSL